MPEISKKELRSKVEIALAEILKSLKIIKPSKKTRTLVRKLTKKYSDQLRIEIKKMVKKSAPKRKPPGKAKVSGSKARKS